MKTSLVLLLMLGASGNAQTPGIFTLVARDPVLSKNPIAAEFYDPASSQTFHG